MFRVVLSLILLGPCLGAQPGVDTLEGAVREWLALEETISREATAHQSALDQIALRTNLIAQERDELLARADELERAGEGDRDERLRAFEARAAAHEDRLARLEPLVARAESDLAAWTNRIPGPLFADLRPAWSRLGGGGSVPRRLQAVLVALAQLEALQHGVHVRQMTLDGRVHDTLHLGLADIYALAPDGSHAGHATWSGDAWAWTWNEDLAPDIRRALAAARGEAGPKPARLPVGGAK